MKISRSSLAQMGALCAIAIGVYGQQGGPDGGSPDGGGEGPEVTSSSSGTPTTTRPSSSSAVGSSDNPPREERTSQVSSSSSSSLPLDGSSAGPSMDEYSSNSAVKCDSYGGSADYSEVLSGTGSMMTRNTSTATGCPNHVNWQLNPNAPTENPYSAIIPAYPMLMEANETTDLSEATSPTGMMFNGVALFSSWGRVTVVSYETTAFVIEGDSLDLCAGHANPNGMYHYHSTPGCLQEHAMVVAGLTPEEHSPQLGWSYDGFPVYGQLGPEGIEMKMCEEEGAHETYCLDWCSGYEGEVDVDGFKYRYYLSCGADESFFPFTTNCYRGCCPEGIECGGPHLEHCGDTAVAGYTDVYVPEAGTPLTDPYDTELLDGSDEDYVVTVGGSALDCSLYLGSWSADAGNSTSMPTPTPLTEDDTISTDAGISLLGSSHVPVLSASVLAVVVTVLTRAGLF